ncbi:MAG TPA: glycosyltransferase [Thermoflexus sp.]|nr:glycosyltransferase [Thermoflexus sp.]
MNDRKSVAIFTPYFPDPPNTGGKIRSYYLIRALAERLNVDVYTTSHELPHSFYVSSLQQMVRGLHIFEIHKSMHFQDRLRRTLSPKPRLIDYFQDPQSILQAREALRRRDYGVLIADELCMTPYVEQRSDLPRVVLRQKIDSRHIAEVAAAHPWSIEKVLHWIEAWKVRRYERQKMRIYQACVTCSEADAAFVRRDAPGILIQVIPNGVDLERFRPTGHSRRDPSTLLFMGTMYYYPNIDAVLYFFKEIYPILRRARPDLRVQIVGHRPPPEIQRLAEYPGVEVTGSVPDVRPYYERATVFIVPLRLGGGTRLKIIEAMAMGLPVVSTSVGAEGLEIHPGEDILIADDPQAFADSVLRLLSDPALWRQLSAAGQRLARRYDWRELTRPLVDLVEMLMRERKG